MTTSIKLNETLSRRLELMQSEPKAPPELVGTGIPTTEEQLRYLESRLGSEALGRMSTLHPAAIYGIYLDDIGMRLENSAT